MAVSGPEQGDPMTDQPAVEVPPHVLDYISRQGTLTLGSASPAGIPHARTFLYVNDGPTLYFWTRPETTTARQVEQNPVVSFAIDDYSADLRQTKGVQGSGECAVLLSGEEIARVADLFGRKFPDLAPGNTMSISFFRVVPTDLEFIDNTAGTEPREGEFGAEFHRQRAYSVFGDLPTQEVENIVATLQTTNVDAGQVIVREGGPADKFFIVVDGEVQIERGYGGREESLVTLGPGQLFGELSIMRDMPRNSTVKATRPTTLLAIDRDTFRDLMSQALGVTPGFAEVIQSRLEALGGTSQLG
jgi:uncharacterized protein YhbP (UPF0306 family)